VPRRHSSASAQLRENLKSSSSLREIHQSLIIVAAAAATSCRGVSTHVVCSPPARPPRQDDAVGRSSRARWGSASALLPRVSTLGPGPSSASGYLAALPPTSGRENVPVHRRSTADGRRRGEILSNPAMEDLPAQRSSSGEGPRCCRSRSHRPAAPSPWRCYHRARASSPGAARSASRHARSASIFYEPENSERHRPAAADGLAWT